MTLPHPTVSDWQQINASTTPPTEAQCESVGRRCFTPEAIQSAYDVGPLYTAGLNGKGETIAIVDSFGSDTIASDLHVFDQAFGVQPMCGEAGVTCAPGMPTFKQLEVQRRRRHVPVHRSDSLHQSAADAVCRSAREVRLEPHPD